MSNLLWVLESTKSDKFPYRLSIKKGDTTLLSLFVQNKWPGAGSQIFCLKDASNSSSNDYEIVEKVPIISIDRYGKRLSVVLDRGVNKRCEFLFLKKKYKNKEGEYEQIFWRTQQGLKEHKPRVKLTAKGNNDLHILIDTNEKYPWKFTNCIVERVQLPAGDYALFYNNEIEAVVERKSFENFRADIANLPILHQKLGELEKYKHSALVIEANYSDYLNPDKLSIYTPSYMAKVIAEIFAFHPKFQIIFAGNRKLANEWTLRFFQAIVSHESESIPDRVAEEISKYQTKNDFTGGIYYDIRKEILENIDGDFTINDLRNRFANTPDSTIRKVLNDLKKEGLIINLGRGKGSSWTKAP
ncbi:ERCC4 domain-containing protein [Thermoanaerobacterium butyriciformans]|uniref:ERCC4-type nuclease n=1 Tax=Thermoanaerobacterium butyriciformans TaxID=1702242 RepID=A0ABS4NH90_9THEO|nr:ERCC4 domain-containing protein [Thermoanaerobacterium butyriciformans]MBP2073048.1 ERCC4-type nuclease [Thermoanaerobacterium butyriciformans]